MAAPTGTEGADAGGKRFSLEGAALRRNAHKASLFPGATTSAKELEL